MLPEDSPEATGAEGPAGAKALSRTQLVFLEELCEELRGYHVGKEYGPRSSPNPSSIFTKDDDKEAKAHVIDHSLPIPNPAHFPARHVTPPFLAS